MSSAPLKTTGARARSGSFLQNSRAAAAVEFALLLPVALIIMAGIVDITQALAVKRKMVEIAFTVSDLVAQRSSISSSDVNSILTGASAIMLPHDTSKLKIVLSVLNISSSGNKVAWASATGTTAPTSGSVSSLTVPASIVVSGVQIVGAQVSYTFTPTFTGLFGESFAFNTQELARPRTSSTITLK